MQVKTLCLTRHAVNHCFDIRPQWEEWQKKHNVVKQGAPKTPQLSFTALPILQENADYFHVSSMLKTADLSHAAEGSANGILFANSTYVPGAWRRERPSLSQNSNMVVFKITINIFVNAGTLIHAHCTHRVFPSLYNKVTVVNKSKNTAKYFKLGSRKRRSNHTKMQPATHV